MDRPTWAMVIRTLYRASPDIPSKDITKYHPFVEGTGLDVETAEEAAETLINWGLAEEIEVWRGEGEVNPDTAEMENADVLYGYQLTSKGFDVAHERELSSRNNRINNSLVFLTFILVVAQIVDVVPIGDVYKVLAGFVILLGMVWAVYSTDILNSR